MKRLPSALCRVVQGGDRRRRYPGGNPDHRQLAIVPPRITVPHGARLLKAPITNGRGERRLTTAAIANFKLYALFDYRCDFRVMDIGCSGGGFVKSILEDGYTEVDLDGIDQGAGTIHAGSNQRPADYE